MHPLRGDLVRCQVGHGGLIIDTQNPLPVRCLVRLVAVSHAPVSPARPRPGRVPCPVDTRIAGPFPGMSLDAMARNLCLVGEKRSRVGEGICGVRMPLPLPARPRARHGARRTSPRPACPASSLYGVMNSRVGPRVSVQNCTPGASVWPSRCVLGRGGGGSPSLYAGVLRDHGHSTPPGDTPGRHTRWSREHRAALCRCVSRPTI